MQARFESTCPRCGQRIARAATIARWNGMWAHAHCPVLDAAVVGRRFDHIDETLGRNAANEYLDSLDAQRDQSEADEARRERERDNAEYAAGVQDAIRIREDTALMGEAWSVQNEYERDLRGLNGDVW